MQASSGPLSLYLHVPFCASRCRYCDFFSVALGEAGPQSVTAVVDETLRQIERFVERLEPSAVVTAFVGGGTPSAIDPAELARLLRPIARLAPAEWTVEANPESLDERFLDACAEAGASRISVGLQSMDGDLLRLLGRPGGAEDNRRAVRLLRDRWRGEVSFDLIAGIPGQTVGRLLDDVALAIAEGVGHVSLYSLTVESGTPLEVMIASGAVRPNRSEVDDELWLAGRQALEEAGYRGYEVSNFSRPGRECRHNLRYWRLEPYVGAGPGAVSTITREAAEAFLGSSLLGGASSGGRTSPVVRLTNPADLARYASGEAASWNVEVEEVAPVSFLLETLMTGLRLAEGIERPAFERRFAAPLAEVVPGLWDRWVARGLADPDPARLRLLDGGRLLLDRLLAELATELRDRPPRDLSLVWP